MKTEDIQLQIEDGLVHEGTVQSGTNQLRGSAPSGRPAGSAANNPNRVVNNPDIYRPPGNEGIFACCAPRPVRDVDLTGAPDEDFHSDTIVKLTNGFTAYRLIEPVKPGNVDPPLIVLLHGMLNSSYMWADVAELLADFDQGPLANVLIYDIFGHGRSPWNGKNLSLDVLVMQVKELLESTGYGEKQVSLIGYDIGGAIAAGFAARFPGLVLSLTMIAPVGVLYNGPFDERSFKSKYFGEMAIYKQRGNLPLKQFDDFYNIDESSNHYYLISKQVAMSTWQLEHTPGYLGSLLSMYRYFPMREMEEIYYAIGRNLKNVLIVWGGRDKVTPYQKCVKFMEKAFPSATIVDITDAGHNCVYEKFEEVVTEVLQFHRDVYYGKV